MKHKLKFSIILLTFALLMTAAVAKTHTSKKGYSVAIPKGWTVDTSKMMGTDVIFLAKPLNSFRANLNVITTPSNGQTLAQVKAQINSTYPGVFNTYKKLAQGNTKIGGFTALYLTATHKTGSPNKLLRMHQVFVLRKGSAYIFTCTASNADYAKSDAAFEMALASVKWTK